MITITMLASVARNGVIGRYDGVSPELKPFVKLSEDLTRGKTAIMGRKTFETYGALPMDRHNIVVTRSKTLSFEGCTRANSLRDAIRLARDCGEEDIFVIGGGEVFKQFWNIADKLIVNSIPSDVSGPVKFPHYTGLEFRSTWLPCDWAPSKEYVRLVYDRAA